MILLLLVSGPADDMPAGHNQNEQLRSRLARPYPFKGIWFFGGKLTESLHLRGVQVYILSGYTLQRVLLKRDMFWKLRLSPRGYRIRMAGFVTFLSFPVP